MVEGLDMALEDIIKNNKKSAAASGSRSSRGGRGHGGRGSLDSSGVGPTRRMDNKLPVRTNPYAAAAPPSVSYAQQALHVPQMMVGRPPTNSEAGTKLYISNLDYEVTNEDIKERILARRFLSVMSYDSVICRGCGQIGVVCGTGIPKVLFSDVGELKRYSIHYDRSGRSKGTAEVVYVRHPDAVAAMKRYNNMQLDGKPMRLELVGVNIVTPVPIPPVHHGIRGNPMVSSRSTQGRIVGRGQDRGGDNAQRASGRGRARPQKVSAEDLDADLEKYHLERMHIK